MRADSNATPSRRVTSATEPTGLALAALGVVGFSLTLPATRVAVADLDPFLVAFGRALVAAGLAAAFLRATRLPWPSRAQARRLLLVVIGVVVGFPLFTSLALITETSSHGAIVVGVLPAATAIWAVVRAGERPSAGFWLAAAAGLCAVLAFAIVQGARGLEAGDLFLLAAVALGGLGYAEGGAVSRELGGSRTICWALLLALPAVVPIVIVAIAAGGLRASVEAWAAFSYLSVVSMLLGFFAWYAGLARGGVARASQVQLAQPLLTLGWSVLLLGEQVHPAAVPAALAVLASVAATQRARVDRGPVGRVAREGAVLPGEPSGAGTRGHSPRPTGGAPQRPSTKRQPDGRARTTDSRR